MKRLIALATGMYLALIWVELTGQTVRPLPGDPLPGITSGEFEEFRLGLGDFTEVETVEDGLGPAFNGSSCAVCHSVPAIGGAGSTSGEPAIRGRLVVRALALLGYLFDEETRRGVGCRPIRCRSES